MGAPFSPVGGDSVGGFLGGRRQRRLLHALPATLERLAV